MYELSHDLIGALSPMIVVLAMMMMTGGAGGSSSYVFSGKTDDVGFLLLKARATARKLACAHRRVGNGFVLNGGPPISYAEFFDLSAAFLSATRRHAYLSFVSHSSAMRFCLLEFFYIYLYIPRGGGSR